MSKIVVGAGAAQALGLAALPLISRLYFPEDFGLFSAVLVPVGLLAIVASMQFQHALVIPKVDSHARGLLYVGCVGAIVAGVVAVLLASTYLAFRDRTGEISWAFAVLTGVAVAACVLGQLSQGLAVRSGEFRAIGFSAAIRVSACVVLQVGLGVIEAGAEGLLAGYAIGELAASLMLFGKSLTIHNTRPTSRCSLWYLSLIRRYWDFASHGSAQELLNSASQGLPVLLLNHYYGEGAAGAYSFAMRLLLAPVQLFGNALRQVLFRDLTQNSNDPLRQLATFRQVTLAVGVLALGGAAIVAPYLPQVIPYFFGEAWVSAGEYAPWLSFWAALLLANVPATLAFRILRRQVTNLRFNVTVLVVRAAVLCLGGMFFASNIAVAAFSMAGVAINLAYIALAHRLLWEKCR